MRVFHKTEYLVSPWKNGCLSLTNEFATGMDASNAEVESKLYGVFLRKGIFNNGVG